MSAQSSVEPIATSLSRLEMMSCIVPERSIWDDRAAELAEYWEIEVEQVRDIYRTYNVDGVRSPPRFDGSTLARIFTSYNDAARLQKDISRLMLHYTRFRQAFDVLQAVEGLAVVGSRRRVIDYGCGVADFGLAFALHGYQVTLVDLQDGVLDFAEWRLRRRGLDCVTIPVHEGDEYPKLPPADVVVAGDVLEHLRDPRALVRNVSDALKGQGLFWVPDFPFKAKSVGGAHLESAALLRDETRVLLEQRFERTGGLKHLMRAFD